MNKETLDTALHLGQLVTLLTPLANGSKSFHNRLSRLRSRIENQVELAVVAGGTDAGRRAARCLAELRDALEASIKSHVNVELLLNKSAASREVYVRTILHEGSRRMNGDTVILGDAEAVKLEPALGKGSDTAVRASTIHAYVSAVRNSAWLPTLLRLELALTAATNASSRLEHEQSSPGGREGLANNLSKLCTVIASAASKPDTAAPAKRTRPKKLAVKADGLFNVQVVFRAEQLLALPEIAKLTGVRFPGGETAPTLAQLLEKATAPVPVGDDEVAADVAQRVLDELVAGLVARKQAAEEARAAIRAEAEAAAAESAVAALQQLNPALLAALKNNPSLLERV